VLRAGAGLFSKFQSTIHILSVSLASKLRDTGRVRFGWFFAGRMPTVQREPSKLRVDVLGKLAATACRITMQPAATQCRRRRQNRRRCRRAWLLLKKEGPQQHLRLEIQFDAGAVGFEFPTTNVLC